MAHVITTSTLDTACAEATATVTLPPPRDDDRTECLVQVRVKGARSTDVRKKAVVMVVDTSASMNGDPRKTVLSIMSELDESVVVVNYSDIAIRTTPAKLRGNWRESTTHFRAAFGEIRKILRERESLEGPVAPVDYEVVFLTDGVPSDDPMSAYGSAYWGSPESNISLGELRKASSSYKLNGLGEVTIHCLGIGTSSALDLLEQIRVSGTQEGVYAFASAKRVNGASSASNELLEILRTFISFTERTRTGVVEWESDGRDTGFSTAATFHREDDGDGSDAAAAETIWTASVWMSMPLPPPQKNSGKAGRKEGEEEDSQPMPPLKVTFTSLPDPVRVDPMYITVVDNCPSAHLRYAVEKLKRRVLATGPSVERGERGSEETVRSLLCDYENLCKALAEKKVPLPFTKSLAELVAELAEVRTSLAILLEYAASVVSGSRDAISELHRRVRALRFKGRFSKSRRNVLIDKRTLKNEKMLAKFASRVGKIEAFDIDEELSALAAAAGLREDEVEQVYLCFISCESIRYFLASIKDISKREKETNGEEALASREVPDIMLAGGTVTEGGDLLVDAPWLMKIRTGPTIVGYESFVGSIEFCKRKDDLSDSSRTFYEEITATLMPGLANESITAGLPIYCTASHFAVVKAMLPILVSYLFTRTAGDGYAPSQIIALYAILGQLWPGAKGRSEAERRLVWEFGRVCDAICFDTELLADLKFTQPETRPLEVYAAFLKSPRGRTKELVPVLEIVQGIEAVVSGSFRAPPSEDPTPAGACWPVPRWEERERIFAVEAMRRRILGLAKQANFSSFERVLAALFARLMAHQRAPDEIAGGASPKIESAASWVVGDTFVSATATKFDPALFSLDEKTMLRDPSVISDALSEHGVVSSQEDVEWLKGCEFDCLLHGVLLALGAPTNVLFKELVHSSDEVEAAIDTLGGTLAHFAKDNVKEAEKKWNLEAERIVGQANLEFAVNECVTAGQFSEIAGRILKVRKNSTEWDTLVDLLVRCDEETFSHISQGPQKIACLMVSFSFVPSDIPVDERAVACGVHLEQNIWKAGRLLGPGVRARIGDPGSSSVSWLLEYCDKLSTGHKYRESDTPNRHGHCTSRPLWVADPTNPNIPLICKGWDK